MTSCTSIEVAKGVTKVTKSLETSVKNIFDSTDEKKEEQKKLDNEPKTSIENEIEKKIFIEEQKISKEQKMVSNVVKKQKNISTINLFNKTINELNQQLGFPLLIREDGNTTTLRFDSKNCRLFVFMNSAIKTPRVEYYELRNSQGELIELQTDIELCFKEIKPV